MSISKIITNSGSEEIERWQYPTIDNTVDCAEDGANAIYTAPVTAKQIEKIQHEAYKEAYESGFNKGLEAGNKAATEKNRSSVTAIDQILKYLASPLKELDIQLEQQLLQLVILITRQIIRRELKTDKGQVVSVIREAVSLLPITTDKLEVRIHPDDTAIVKEIMASDPSDMAMKIVSDPTLSRGDCKVITEYSQINASVESRLNSVIAQLLGNERESDNDSNSVPNDR